MNKEGVLRFSIVLLIVFIFTDRSVDEIYTLLTTPSLQLLLMCAIDCIWPSDMGTILRVYMLFTLILRVIFIFLITSGELNMSFVVYTLIPVLFLLREKRASLILDNKRWIVFLYPVIVHVPFLWYGAIDKKFLLVMIPLQWLLLVLLLEILLLEVCRRIVAR